MGQPYSPQQLTVESASVDGELYIVVLILSDPGHTHLRLCSHTTWIAAWKCKHGDCTKGHNLNAQAKPQRDSRWSTAPNDSGSLS